MQISHILTSNPNYVAGQGTEASNDLIYVLDLVQNAVNGVLDIENKIVKSEVEKHLKNILKSESFKGKKQVKKVLEYIIKQTFSGLPEGLSQKRIAIEALGKTERFNSDENNYVRILVSRVRRKLEEYYQNEGKMDSIIISIPRGGYTAEFTIKGKGEDKGDSEEKKKNIIESEEIQKNPEVIQEVLKKISESQYFHKAEKQGGCLKYVVNKTLRGEESYISAILIALDIWEDSKYEQNARVAMGKVRRKLNEYYKEEGKNDLIIINIPTGTYVPEFRRNSNTNFPE